MMKRTLLGVGMALAMVSCNQSTATNEEVKESNAVTQAETGITAEVKTINSEEAKTLLEQEKDLVVLDVRTPEEYTAGHLANARLMNFYDADFTQQLKTLDPSKTYLVYCAVGGRSRQAVQQMQQLGFKLVFDATEGYGALQAAGVPVE
ncbi:rhodanese-like domain-containing protein [Pontibacter mangrovi]|uniref:Rhodanese-like domain-containing protein n=1 Tax=Pontibacter mangrovi TaxID=2589816 RepID=A0A501WGF8_9BACT|nr:rhodanese-like domain-containing protein [Pontibacter mangrovi]TPE46241.1 rhodanese-like domain-containing protein [Pontibacter mangrovi]